MDGRTTHATHSRYIFGSYAGVFHNYFQNFSIKVVNAFHYKIDCLALTEAYKIAKLDDFDEKNNRLLRKCSANYCRFMLIATKQIPPAGKEWPAGGMT